MNASMNLALIDATTNCERDGATAIITLRAGFQLVGKLTGRETLGTRHMKTQTGWATFLVGDVVAVETRRDG